MSCKSPLAFLNAAVFMRGQVFILPVLYVFYQKNGLSLSDFFYFQSIATFVSLLFYVPAGYLADIFSKRKILILSMLFAFARAVLWLFFSGYWIVLMGEISYALSRPFFSGIVDSYMCDYLKTQNCQQKMAKNYGRLNFYMSLSSAVSALIGPFFLIDFPLKFLIFLEVIFIFLTIILLICLPETPIFNKAAPDLMQRYQNVFSVCRFITQKKNLLIPMLYSGLYSATTILLVWCFQPLMLASMIPVILFGIISLINHMSRATFGWFSSKIGDNISLLRLQNLTGYLFLFAIMGISASFMVKSMYLTFFFLMIVCTATGLQLTYTILAISYVHSKIESTSRALISSLNFMIAAMASSGLLFVFKMGVEYIQIDKALIGYLIFFIFSIFILHRKTKKSHIQSLLNQ